MRTLQRTRLAFDPHRCMNEEQIELFERHRAAEANDPLRIAGVLPSIYEWLQASGAFTYVD